VLSSLNHDAVRRVERAVLLSQIDRTLLEGAPAVMRLSARNQLKGTVTAVTKGATTAHVKVDIGNNQIVTSSITNEAVDELGIKTGGSVIVVIKASDVMIAVN
jgi:molybdopterin-binding protein